jgi:hypothetical protein
MSRRPRATPRRSSPASPRGRCGLPMGLGARNRARTSDSTESNLPIRCVRSGWAGHYATQFAGISRAMRSRNPSVGMGQSSSTGSRSCPTGRVPVGKEDNHVEEEQQRELPLRQDGSLRDAEVRQEPPEHHGQGDQQEEVGTAATWPPLPNARRRTSGLGNWRAALPSFYHARASPRVDGTRRNARQRWREPKRRCSSSR